MSETLDIVLVQDNPVAGDTALNADTIIDRLRCDPAADLIVFPECFLTGYPLGDLVMRPGFLFQVEAAVARVRDAVIAADGPAVLFGAPLAGAALPYNAAYLIEPSGETRVVRKHELPNHDVFDERRTFAMSDERPTPLPFRGFNLGVMICEDMWHGDVARGLADELADILVVLNGSPYSGGKQAKRRTIARTRIRDTGLPLLYANLVGGQDELVFDGASFIMNPEGGHTEARAFAPAVMRMRLDRDADGLAHVHLVEDTQLARYPEDRLETDYTACVVGLRDYVAKSGMDRVVVGVSGGLDSALVLTMAVDALGADKVTGVMMPSRHTSAESTTLAQDLMTRLGVTPRTVSIDPAFDLVDRDLTAFLDDMGSQTGQAPEMGVTRENLQSRLRGLALMGITNAMGGIVLSTGNKSEMAVGYATLYGDMNGGFNPLKSVWKSQAFAMAEWRNTVSDLVATGPVARTPIPERIISRPPSAELAEGQVDQASLGSYDILDTALISLIETRASTAEVARVLKKTFGDDDLFRRSGGYSADSYADRVSRLVRTAQYKRDQSCPGVKLNITDFGLGWRYPIAGTYRL